MGAFGVVPGAPVTRGPPHRCPRSSSFADTRWGYPTQSTPIPPAGIYRVPGLDLALSAEPGIA
jgi:hypothetical protein